MRLGLSDSMRSVAMEDTEPLYTATHRRTPRRPREEAPATDQSTEEKPKTVRVYTVPRGLLGVVVGVILLSMGAAALGRSLRAWTGGNSQVDKEFEQLERSLAMLGKNTAKLEASASSFLKSCQSEQVAASTRTELLATSARRSFEDQVKTHVEEHEEVMREVMEHFAQQEQQIQETRQRLLEMNITVPVQITATPVPNAGQREELQRLGRQEVDVDQSSKKISEETDAGQFASALAELFRFAEKNLQQDGGDRYNRLNVETISIQMTPHHTDSEPLSSFAERPNSYSSYGPFFFYSFVICVSTGYLWTSFADMRKKQLQDKWSWSPVPRILSRSKAFLSSIVVIEDLRGSADSSTEDNTSIPLEHIEC